MKKRFTLLITCSALLMLSIGTAWGQAKYIGAEGNTPVSQPRTQSVFGKQDGINNYFGAGENATVTTGTVDNGATSPPYSPLLGQGYEATPTEKLTIGGNNNSLSNKNYVINSYNADGQIRGWYRTWTYDYSWTWIQADGSSSIGWQPGGGFSWTGGPYTCHDFPGNDAGTLGSISGTGFTGSVAETSGKWPHGEPATNNSGLEINSPQYVMTVPYTRNQSGGYDDGVSLIQKTGTAINNLSTYTNAGQALIYDGNTNGNGNLEWYVRPTTVAVKSVSIDHNTIWTLDSITFDNNQWFYRRWQAGNAAFSTGRADYHHEHGACPTISSSPNETGTAIGTRTWHQVTDVYWTSEHAAGGYVDGIVQLLQNANVCVLTDVSDITEKLQSWGSVDGGNAGTDAGLDLPSLGNGPFALRVQGNINPINIYQNATVTRQDYSTSDAVTNSQSEDIAYLYDGSVLGVRGTYDPKNALVYTENNGTTDDNGMIEVGPGTVAGVANHAGTSNIGPTAAQNGQLLFNIFSGGYLRNSSGCWWDCEAMNISTAQVFPKLWINDDTQQLSIINDGLCCDAEINFNATGGAGVLVDALANATGKGSVLVNANGGRIYLAEPMSLKANTDSNSVYLYSDNSYITADDSVAYKSTYGLFAMNTHADHDNTYSCDGDITVVGPVIIDQQGSQNSYLTTVATITGSNINTYPYYTWGTYNIPNQGTTGSAAVVKTLQGDDCADYLSIGNYGGTGTVLDTFQTVIRADSNAVSLRKHLYFTGKDAGLLVQAKDSVNVWDSTKIDFSGYQGKGDAVIQSFRSYVKLGNGTGNEAQVYNGYASGNLLISGRTNVDLYGPVITTHDANATGSSNIAAETGGTTFHGYNKHTQGAEGHYLVFGDKYVYNIGDDTIDMVSNATPDYAKIWSPAGWVTQGGAFIYDGKNGPLVVLAEGTTNQGGTLSGSAPANTYGNISFDGATKITYAASSPGLTQIQSVNDNVNFKDTVYYTNTDNMDESGLLMIQAGRDIYADQGTGTVSNSNSTFTIDHWGDRQIIMEAHRDIVIWDSLKVNHKTPNNGEFTMKAGYKANWDPCYGKGFTDTVYAQTAGNLTEYAGNVLCGSDSGNIIFNGNVLIDYSNNSAASDTVATVINAYRTIYVNNKFDYLTNSTIQAENHRIDHHVHPMTAGNLLMYAETGNVEAVEDEDSSVKDTVNITVNAASNNNGDIRIQAGPYLCVPNCNDLFDQNHGNILFNKPLNVTNNGSGFTILQAHRDIETQIDAPATFTHANVSGNTLSDTATLLVAGRHIETHATMKFDYDHTATDGSITLWAGKMDHPGGLGLSNWACTDALCKTIEEGSYLAPAGIAYRPGTDGTGSAFSQDGRGNGSILLFDTLVFNYYGDSTISLFAYNGNIENDPYLHKLNVGYDELNDEHNAPILFNHYGTGLTQMKAIDIKLHDKLYYEAMQKTAQLKNGQLSINAYDSILTRKIKYVNSTDTGSVFITTAKYKAGADCDVPYNCAEGGPGIHQGHIVLGYGADFGATNVHDSIIFDYNSGATNSTVLGGNIHILAGFEGFEENRITGKKNPKLFFDDIYGIDKGKGKAFGGNITFDYMEFYMPTGAGTAGGYTEIRTPNGNIWGKDSILYHGINGNFLVDAGLGSVDDSMAIRWGNVTCLGASEYLLNTNVPDNCGDTSLWRTGNIMMKGANLNFGNPTTNTVGTGNAVFRTREGFIDTYDAFTVDSMGGDLLKYAAMDNRTQGLRNNWGDVSERDFQYTPVKESGSVFFGADDNIMLNYGNSNLEYNNYGQTGMGYPGNYDVTKLQTSYASPLRDSINMYRDANPYYYTSYEGYIDGLATATFDVNVDGYMFYRNSFYDPKRKSHLLYRGCKQGSADCSGYTGDCVTTSNGARDIELNFYEDINGNKVQSGGFASVASNYIDIFTGFTYYGGEGSAMGAVPGMGSLHGESVAGYGLYMKSQFNGTGYNYPEKRRATCEGCGEFSSFPMEGESSRAIPEMTYIGFHDDARIHTHRQKSLLEAPVIEFFGHAEIDAETNKGTKTNITLKADSLIFHDSVIFAGHSVELKPFTTDATQRANDMRYGVINDKGRNRANYSFYGPAIEMEDRSLPVLELGYQRCNEPNSAPHSAPNIRSLAGKEQTPTVGGDVIVAFKYGYAMPMFNTVVANHARISFITDSLDNMSGGEFVDAFIRTDLLRIRNKVEFYTDPTAPNDRKGKFVMATPVQMDDKMVDPGMYTRHLHLERGSELSLPGEDSLTVIPTTVVGGYGNIHENVMVKANGILAPGFASLMEGDCQTPNTQGKLTVHNLQMEKDAVLRLSISNRNCIDSPDGPIYCTQTDTIVVQDTVYFTDGRVPVVILPETETLDPGCYLFMVYGDSTGVSQEYVKNFVLKEIRYGDYYFSLYFGERGKVYLCVTSYPIPEVQRWIDILEVPGVTTVPGFGRSHVFGHQNFTFTARYSGSPLKISAKGFYSGNIVDLDHTSRLLDDGSYQYTIYQVVEPWTVYIGPDPRSDVSNEGLPGQRIWTYKNTLYINVAMDDIVSIYNLTGVLYQKVEIPAGTNKFTLERGMYIVTLKDGSVHKIVIK